MSWIDDLAGQQFGLVTRRQALDHLSAWQLRRAVERGGLVRVAPGVYRSAGAPRSFRQRALAACLAYGPLVAVSHRSAGVLWGLEAVAPPADLELSVPLCRSGRVAGVPAQRARLGDDEVVDRHGIPVTSPARTLLDLTAVVTPEVLARSVDDLLRSRHARADRLLAWLDQPAQRGRHGTRLLRGLLLARSRSGVPDSVGVAMVLRWIHDAGLATPVSDHPVLVAGRVRHLDMAYPGSMIAIEFHGWQHHQMRARFDDDQARASELALAGWLLIVVTSSHPRSHTVDRIARALAVRGGPTGGDDTGRI